MFRWRVGLSQGSCFVELKRFLVCLTVTDLRLFIEMSLSFVGKVMCHIHILVIVRV